MEKDLLWRRMSKNESIELTRSGRDAIDVTWTDLFHLPLTPMQIKGRSIDPRLKPRSDQRQRGPIDPFFLDRCKSFFISQLQKFPVFSFRIYRPRVTKQPGDAVVL